MNVSDEGESRDGIPDLIGLVITENDDVLVLLEILRSQWEDEVVD